MRVAIFTTCDEVYDGTECRPIGHVGFTAEGEPVRAVRVPLDRAVDQVRRYLAAGGRAWNRHDWIAQVTRYGAHADVSLDTVESAVTPT